MAALLVPLVLVLQAIALVSSGPYPAELIPKPSEAEKALIEGQSYKLPTWILPKHYDLQLVPNPNNSTIWGRMVIEVEVMSNTDKIALHAHQSIELDLENSYVKSLNSIYATDRIKVVSVEREESTDLLELTLEKPLRKDPLAWITLEFTNKIRDDMTGFYRNPTNDDLVLATNFHRKFARRAFPCFDEVTFKTTFQVSVAKPEDESLTVLSNTHFDSETSLKLHTRTKGWRHDKVKMLTFAKTPRMSIHLLSIVMGRFEHSECQAEADRGHKVPVRFYSMPGKRSQGMVAMEAVCRSLGKFKEYFAHPFELKKLDIVALPELTMPSLENWGLISCLEEKVLVDQLISDDEAKSEAAVTVLRATAQQWLGNLVSMKLWSEQWLHEGLASWLGHKMVSEVFPNLDHKFNYLRTSRKRAMVLDSLPSANSTSRAFNTKESNLINDKIFDRVAALLRWMDGVWMPADTFRASLRTYIDRHQFSSAGVNKFIESFEKQSQKSVSKFIYYWTEHRGYPLISLEVDATGKVELAQQRFIVGSKQSEYDYWEVPVSVMLGNSKQTSEEFIDFTGLKGDIVLPNWFKANDPDSWILVNPDATGLYRVRYDKRSLTALLGAMKRGKLTPIQRWQLLEGMSAACRNDLVGYDDMMALLEAFLSLPGGELNGYVLSELWIMLSTMERLFPSQLDKAFVVRLFEPAYKHYGLAAKGGQESAGDRLARQTALTVLIEHSHPEAVKKSLDLFHQKAKMVDLLDVHLRKPLYLAAAMFGNTLEYNLLKSMALAERSPVELKRLAVAWVQADKADRLDEFWSWASNAQTDLNDRAVILSHGLASQAGVALMKRLLESEPAKLAELSSLYSIYAAISWSRSDELLEAARGCVEGEHLGPKWPKYLLLLDEFYQISRRISSRDGALVASLSSKLASE